MLITFSIGGILAALFRNLVYGLSIDVFVVFPISLLLLILIFSELNSDKSRSLEFEKTGSVSGLPAIIRMREPALYF